MPLSARAFRPHRRTLVKLGCLILLIVTANFAAGWLVDTMTLELRPSTEDMVHRMIVTSAVAYTVLIAVPFVPGVEIGLTLIGMFGAAIVLLVYLSTLAGLSLSFIVGRLVPMRGLIKLLDDLRLHRASRMLETIEPMDRDGRLAYLLSRAPNRFLPFLLRHRYIALAVVINLPGNIVIGGGGGIALMAGASRLYSLPGYLATIVIAVSPLPLAVILLGYGLPPG